MSPASQSFRFRESRRLLRTAPVRLSVTGEEGELVARTRDLATGGMFVSTSELRPVGTVVDFRLELGSEDAPDTVRGEAAVAWLREDPGGADQPAGMGMQFTRVEAPGAERLAQLFSDEPDDARPDDAQPGESRPDDAAPEAAVEAPPPAPAAEAAELPEAASDEADLEVEGPAAIEVEASPPDPAASARGDDSGAPAELSGEPASGDSEWSEHAPERPAWVWPTVAGAVAVAVVLFFLRGWIAGPRDGGADVGGGARTQETTPAAAAPQSAEPAVEQPAAPAAAPVSPPVGGAAPDRAAGASTSDAPARVDASAPGPPTQGQTPPANATALRTITASVRGARTVVEIVGNAPFRRHHVLPLDAPPRLLVRLIGVQRPHDAGGVRAPRLRGVRTGVHGRGATRNLHVVIDLAAPDIAATVERRGDRVIVSLSD